MTGKTHIRQATSEDVLLLTDLICNSFNDVAQKFGLTPENCPKHPSNCTTQWIEQHLERGVIYYILECDEVPVGCVAFERASIDFCYIERLAVLPEHRRKGFGKKLVKYVLLQGRSIGAKTLGVGIISKQKELKDWYQNIGFVLGETKEYDHLPFLVSFMRYELGE